MTKRKYELTDERHPSNQRLRRIRALTKDERDQLRLRVSDRARVRTHYDGCHLEPDHRDCAIVRLLDALDDAEARIVELERAPRCACCESPATHSDCDGYARCEVHRLGGAT